MAGVVERVDRLEETLNRFIEQTVVMLAANRQDIAEIRASNARTDRMLLAMWQQAEKEREQADKDREQANKDREQANKDREQANKDREQANQERREADLRRQQEELNRQKTELCRQQEEKKRLEQADKERKDFNRQLAGISDRLGSLIEDMVAPNAPRIARQLFQGDEVLTSSIRVCRRHPSNSGLTIELDLLVVGGSHVLVGEAKSKVTVEKVAAFLEKVRSISEFFPELSGFDILPMIASVNIEPSLVVHLSRMGVYALGFGDETMEILNPDLLRPEIAKP